MITAGLSLACFAVLLWILWQARKAGSDSAVIKQLEAERHATAKAANARADIATGGGVPIERDSFNRDNLR